MTASTPFDFIQALTRTHRREHGCGAYTFEDGHGLMSIARESGAARCLELGTALGFTACCLASAGPETRVDTIERDPLHVALARENIEEAGMEDRVTVHEGEFMSVTSTLAAGYDLAFFDGFEPSFALIERMRQLLGSGFIANR